LYILSSHSGRIFVCAQLSTPLRRNVCLVAGSSDMLLSFSNGVERLDDYASSLRRVVARDDVKLI